ncbi:hypothetical protein SZN_13245 [Streptomyces zinciresistens K42]|uniref:Uncharacterized protein n=1 Tax=Streptomyces zinciresistens K42 TaxID=700597 RepID=G2GAX6_9ACTN|nr:hypothetical protein SZN_13245 [Streptomyces zinciresistens K42]
MPAAPVTDLDGEDHEIAVLDPAAAGPEPMRARRPGGFPDAGVLAVRIAARCGRRGRDAHGGGPVDGSEPPPRRAGAARAAEGRRGALR